MALQRRRLRQTLRWRLPQRLALSCRHLPLPALLLPLPARLLALLLPLPTLLLLLLLLPGLPALLLPALLLAAGNRQLAGQAQPARYSYLAVAHPIAAELALMLQARQLRHGPQVPVPLRLVLHPAPLSLAPPLLLLPLPLLPPLPQLPLLRLVPLLPMLLACRHPQ